MKPLDRIDQMGQSLDIERLEKVHKRGSKIIARCPACAEQGHDKSGDHLVIEPDRRFGCVMNAGSAGHDHRRRIFDLAGLSPIATHPLSPVSRSGGKDHRVFCALEEAVHALESQVKHPCVIRWTYHHADGTQAFVMCRFNLPDGNKSFRPIRKDVDGWRIKGMDAGTRPLYRLPDLMKEDATTPVFVAEGEKCADAIVSLGLVATTSSHGANAAKGTAWTPLAGRNIALLPDADEAGARYVREVHQILASLNPPATVRIIALPGIEPLGKGADVADWLVDRDKAEAHDALLQLAQDAPVLVSDSTDSTSGPAVASAADWLLEPEPPPPDYILSGVFERRDAVLLVGPTKGGKSYLTQQMAICLAAGLPFLDIEVPHPVRVLYVDLENSEAWIKRRLRPMVQAMGLTAEQIRNLMFVAARRNRSISIEQILEDSASIRPDVLVLDPVYKLDAADENDQTSRKRLVSVLGDIADQADCTVVLVHHDPKGDASLRDVRDRGSGSSILNRDVDCTIAITVKKSKNQVPVHCLSILARNAPAEGDRTLRFIPDGYFLAEQQASSPVQSAGANRKPERKLQAEKCSARVESQNWRIQKAASMLTAAEPITAVTQRLSQEFKIGRQAARCLLEQVGHLPDFTIADERTFPRRRLVGPSEAVASVLNKREARISKPLETAAK